jgi:hypothetical protein
VGVVGWIAAATALHLWWIQPQLEEHGSVDADVPEEERMRRTQRRGTVASGVNSILTSSVIFLLEENLEVDPQTSIALMGALLGGTLGFVWDSVLGTDEGFARVRAGGLASGMRFGLGALVSPQYARYVATMLFDLFISAMAAQPILVWAKEVPFLKRHPGVATGLISFLISVITFLSYTNATRFAWGYPSPETEDVSGWIRGTDMQLALAVASVSFLHANTGGEGLNAPNAKLALVVGTFVYMCALSYFNVIDPVARVTVRPRNRLVATLADAEEEVEAGQVLGRAALVFEEGEVGEEERRFEVLRVLGGGRVEVLREVPRHVYDRRDVPTADEVAEGAPWGALVLLGLGGAAVAGTVATSSEAGTKPKWALGGLAMAYVAAYAGLAVVG